MKTVEIVAKAGKEKDAKEFRTEVEMPETIDEAISVFGEDEVYSLWKQQKVVRLQAALRNPGARKTTSTYGIYKKLIDRGFEDAEARAVSEYQGNADGSVDAPSANGDSAE